MTNNWINKLPPIGFGTYLIPNNICEHIIFKAINVGYRHIDTAELYENEDGIGKGISNAIKNNIVKRKELFITSKVWPNKNYNDTIKTFNISLDKLNLEYLDLYLIHAPFEKKNRLDQWSALIDLKKNGKLKSIGVSNYGILHINEIEESGLILPDANQIEFHIWSQKPKLIKFLNSKNIKIIAYSSLIPLINWREKEGQKHLKTNEMIEESKDYNSIIKKIARKKNISEAQVLLKWVLNKGISILPKTTNEKHLISNYNLFSFEINKDEMLLLDSLDKSQSVAWGPLNDLTITT